MITSVRDWAACWQALLPFQGGAPKLRWKTLFEGITSRVGIEQKKNMVST